jgi:chromosome segregation ATPase
MELKQFVDNFPLLEDVQEQLKFYKASLSAKQRQLKELELDIELYIRKTSDLKRDIKCIEKEQRDMEEDWVQAAEKSTFSSNLKRTDAACSNTSK